MRSRVPASRDIRRVLDAVLFWSVLIAFATAPRWIVHIGLDRMFNELALFLFPPHAAA